ncbi:MAG: hypothetical protein ACI32E_00190 [Bacilli bacterium]
MTKKKYLFLVLIFVVVLVLSFFMNVKTSTTIAHYRSDLDASDYARIAKWDVRSVSKKNGESILLDAGFNDNIVSGSGNWFFEVENLSEVRASISNSSKIKFRLDGDSLKDKDIDGKLSWDFLTGSDNPVNFIIYLYNTSAENLLSYKKDDTILSFNDFSSLNDKTGYEEIVTLLPGVNRIEVINTNSSNFNDDYKFTKKDEIIDGKIVTYYELEFSLSSVIGDTFIDLGLDDNKTTYAFQVYWNVESSGSGSGLPGTEDKEYIAYSYKAGTGPSGKFTVDGIKYDYNYTISGNPYYIERTNKDLFEYLKYTSSLGGEPHFEFYTGTIDGNDTYMRVKYSDLTGVQQETIESYKTLKGYVTSIADLKHLIEYFEYQQYKTFVQDMKEFTDSLPYLSMGIQCTISFSLVVEQVD